MLRWLAAIVVLLAQVHLARAQTGATFSSYITPFPDNDTYRVQVWGDDMAEGLLGGLLEQMAGDPRLVVQKRHVALNGVMRGDGEDDIKALEGQIAKETAHVVIVQIGMNDRISWRQPNGRRAGVGSDPWRAEYGRRLERVMRAFRARGAAVYWVGLPIMRRSDASEDAEAMNEVARERAHAAGIRFIDIYAASADEDGGYSAYGPDINGTNRLLRQGDGVMFTAAGSRKIAHFVERELKRDLAQARSERSVQLAGTETEQRQIRPHAVAIAAPRSGAAARTKAGAPKGPTASDGELRADNGRIELRPSGVAQGGPAIAIDLPRPAIPATVLSLLARRETADRAGQPGEPLQGEVDGVPLQLTIVNTGDAATDRRKVPPTQTPLFRVLVKGEHLPPKQGRADDIPWPPDETGSMRPATPAAVPAAASPPAPAQRGRAQRR